MRLGDRSAALVKSVKRSLRALGEVEQFVRVDARHPIRVRTAPALVLQLAGEFIVQLASGVPWPSLGKIICSQPSPNAVLQSSTHSMRTAVVDNYVRSKISPVPQRPFKHLLVVVRQQVDFKLHDVNGCVRFFQHSP